MSEADLWALRAGSRDLKVLRGLREGSKVGSLTEQRARTRTRTHLSMVWYCFQVEREGTEAEVVSETSECL